MSLHGILCWLGWHHWWCFYESRLYKVSKCLDCGARKWVRVR